jgi:hypothetical protein
MQADLLKLIAYGKVMDDDAKTLKDYSLKDGDFVVVMVSKVCYIHKYQNHIFTKELGLQVGNLIIVFRQNPHRKGNLKIRNLSKHNSSNLHKLKHLSSLFPQCNSSSSSNPRV